MACSLWRRIVAGSSYDDEVQLRVDLPGHELVIEGLEDLQAGRETESAMLVAMAGRRLGALGIQIPTQTIARPSHRLYELLSEAGPGAHSRYNALVGRLVSFARAAERDATGR
jgi:hypothetical protein